MRFLLIFLCLVTSLSVASAQESRKKNDGNRGGTATPTYQGGTATRPSDNPFQDPLGQVVPPAVSTNPQWNNRQTNVPLTPNR